MGMDWATYSVKTTKKFSTLHHTGIETIIAVLVLMTVIHEIKLIFRFRIWRGLREALY